MKREYRVADELGKQRSVGKFREFAEDGASVQLVLPLLEVMQLVQDGCGQLLREAGVRLMQLVMEEEAERLVGPRHQPDEQRRGYRWGNEAGKIHEAEEHFGMGLLETESPALAMIAYNNMAVLLERQCEFDAALKYFQRASAINPNDSQATIELATALGERGHYEEGCEILLSISSEDSNSERAMECEYIIRQGEEQIEDDEDFITDLEKELAISPTALTYLNLALFYLQARQTITAITLLQKGLALEPDNLALITTLTDTLLKKRLLEPAIPIVKEALISHPDNPHLVSLQTLILSRTHEFSNALHFFTTSIKLLSDKQTTFAEEPWVMSGAANRLLPSALKSYEYLVAAACHMKDWPLAIESVFAGLDLHLHHFLPPTPENDESRLAVQKSKFGVLEQANFLTATSLEADPQSVAAIALVLHNLNAEYHYPPLDLVIESILPLVPEAEEILGQMLLIQSAFTSEETSYRRKLCMRG